MFVEAGAVNRAPSSPHAAFPRRVLPGARSHRWRLWHLPSILMDAAMTEPSVGWSKPGRNCIKASCGRNWEAITGWPPRCPHRAVTIGNPCSTRSTACEPSSLLRSVTIHPRVAFDDLHRTSHRFQAGACGRICTDPSRNPVYSTRCQLDRAEAGIPACWPNGAEFGAALHVVQYRQLMLCSRPTPLYVA